jgi:hypothetical protein
MTLARACLIAQGEDIHVAAFPGAFELHTGPQLEEPEHTGAFWGHFEVRAHALEAGAFVVSGCAVLNEVDVSAEFPYKGRMNIGYANGGSEVVAPRGRTARIRTVPQDATASCSHWEPAAAAGEPRCNHLGSGAMHVGRKPRLGSINGGQEGALVRAYRSLSVHRNT